MGMTVRNTCSQAIIITRQQRRARTLAIKLIRSIVTLDRCRGRSGAMFTAQHSHENWCGPRTHGEPTSIWLYRSVRWRLDCFPAVTAVIHSLLIIHMTGDVTRPSSHFRSQISPAENFPRKNHSKEATFSNSSTLKYRRVGKAHCCSDLIFNNLLLSQCQ